jgi:ABC-type transport system involved in cytochrome c biogenesis permease subunit
MENYKAALLMVPGELFDITVLKKETWMNRVNLFYTSVGLYLCAFILLGLSWMIQPLILKRASYALLILGFLFHAYGIYLRMHIMGRPPVSTLYESVIFVAFIVILFAIILEYFRRDGLGIFVGAVSGSIFHYIGFSYASDGDTLGMLVAVLNSNFWLATHVTTITMGYGASLVAGFIGHLYLVQAIRQPENKSSLKSIFNNLFGITLIALFFTLFGTILGGIWADQSWGRFWGWDPKENGALLIVLWQLMMVHMRLSGLAKPAEFALGMALNNIIVALAWFGVNLLQVGLHSYGFEDGVARNLFIFIALELIIGFGTYLWPGVKKKHHFV